MGIVVRHDVNPLLVGLGAGGTGFGQGYAQRAAEEREAKRREEAQKRQERMQMLNTAINVATQFGGKMIDQRFQEAQADKRFGQQKELAEFESKLSTDRALKESAVKHVLEGDELAMRGLGPYTLDYGPQQQKEFEEIERKISDVRMDETLTTDQKETAIQDLTARQGMIRPARRLKKDQDPSDIFSKFSTYDPDTGHRWMYNPRTQDWTDKDEGMEDKIASFYGKQVTEMRKAKRYDPAAEAEVPMYTDEETIHTAALAATRRAFPPRFFDPSLVAKPKAGGPNMPVGGNGPAVPGQAGGQAPSLTGSPMIDQMINANAGGPATPQTAMVRPVSPGAAAAAAAAQAPNPIRAQRQKLSAVAQEAQAGLMKAQAEGQGDEVINEWMNRLNWVKDQTDRLDRRVMVSRVNSTVPDDKKPAVNSRLSKLLADLNAASEKTDASGKKDIKAYAKAKNALANYMKQLAQGQYE